MTRADLLALADRVEREEPSVFLTRDVVLACGWEHSPGTDGGNYWSHPIYGLRNGAPDPLHRLDAAASLMPVGWEVFEIAQCYEGWRVQLWFAYDNMICAVAPTEPRARTAAALRAKAQEARDE